MNVQQQGSHLVAIPRAILLVLLLLLAATVALHGIFWARGSQILVGHDLYDIWTEGQRIASGINPYGRIVGQDLLHNENYPTYLPLAYLFAALLQFLGLKEFGQFLWLWRPLTLLCHLGIGLLVFLAFSVQRRFLAGLAASATVLFGRWSTFVIQVHHLEFAATLPMLLSLQLIHRRPRLSGLLLGLSLAIKQLAILILPLQLILLAGAAPNRSEGCVVVRRYVLAAGAIPLLISLPFVWNSPLGFLQSMAFSGTRLAQGNEAAGVAPMALLGLTGVRITMVVLMGFVLASAWRERLSRWSAAALLTLIFVQFNPVLFTQYYEWFLGLVLLSFAHGSEESPRSQQN